MIVRSLFVLLLTHLLGWADYCTVMAAEPEPAQVAGRVVDEAGQPVAGASVRLRNATKASKPVKTDAEGKFVLQAPETSLQGAIVVAIAADGKWQSSVQLPWEYDAEQAQHLELQLAPPRVVEVLVVDVDKKPIAGGKVGLQGGYQYLEVAESGDDGRVRFQIPATLDVQYVFALKDGAGLDYRAYVAERGAAGDLNAKKPELPEGVLTLTLEGSQPLRVNVTEGEGQPVAGVGVYPWLLKKESEPDDLNLSYFPELAQAVSDQQGKAEFAWIPAWHTRPLTLWSRNDDFVHRRGSYDPQTGNGEATLVLDRFVSIRGRVTHEDGTPGAGVTISANGKGYLIDEHRSTAVTDADGRYELKGAPNMVYLVTAASKELAAEPQTGFALFPGKPAEGIDFTLRPATRLFGRVTVGDDRRPVAGQRIDVYHYGTDAHSIKDVKLPNPEESRLWVQPLMVHSVMTDDEGAFELRVGPGKFDIRGPQQTEVQKFEITDEPEKEFSFHAPREEKGLLRGLVLAANPADAVGAKIEGIYRHGLAGRDMLATADAEGRFEVERELHRTVIRARSVDGKLAGVVEIGPDDRLAGIQLEPMARATGRLVDAKTGKPVADRELSYGVRVPIGDDDAPWRTCFGGSARTDEEGRFELDGLVAGQLYELSALLYEQGKAESFASRRVLAFKPAAGEVHDAGEVTFDPGDKR